MDIQFAHVWSNGQVYVQFQHVTTRINVLYSISKVAKRVRKVLQYNYLFIKQWLTWEDTTIYVYVWVRIRKCYIHFKISRLNALYTQAYLVSLKYILLWTNQREICNTYTAHHESKLLFWCCLFDMFVYISRVVK